MLTYILRRLLYSVLVLVATSMLVFFFVTASGDPLAALTISPRVSQVTVENVRERKHLDEPIYMRYGYWVKDAFTNNFGTTLLDNRPILPDLWRAMKNTLQLVLAAEILAILFGVSIGVYSALRQYSLFDYSMTTVQLLRPRDAGLLARADGAGGGGPDLEQHGAQDLPDREPELCRTQAQACRSGSTGRTTSCCRCSCSWWSTSPRTRATCARPCSR